MWCLMVTAMARASLYLHAVACSGKQLHPLRPAIAYAWHRLSVPRISTRLSRQDHSTIDSVQTTRWLVWPRNGRASPPVLRPTASAPHLLSVIARSGAQARVPLRTVCAPRIRSAAPRSGRCCVAQTSAILCARRTQPAQARNGKSDARRCIRIVRVKITRNAPPPSGSTRPQVARVTARVRH